MDIIKTSFPVFHNSFGDWVDDTFRSTAKKEERESALKDAEIARQQTQAMIEMMQQKKAMATNPEVSKQKIIMLGGVAAIMLIAILKFSKN